MNSVQRNPLEHADETPVAGENAFLILPSQPDPETGAIVFTRKANSAERDMRYREWRTPMTPAAARDP